MHLKSPVDVLTGDGDVIKLSIALPARGGAAEDIVGQGARPGEGAQAGAVHKGPHPPLVVALHKVRQVPEVPHL